MRPGTAEAQRELDARRALLQTRLVEERAAKRVVSSAEGTLRRIGALLQHVQAAIAACPSRLDDHWWRFKPDPARPDPRQLAPVWVDEDLQRRRAELFAAAMHVHEVFARRAVTQNGSKSAHLDGAPDQRGGSTDCEGNYLARMTGFFPARSLGVDDIHFDGPADAERADWFPEVAHCRRSWTGGSCGRNWGTGSVPTRLGGWGSETT